MKNLSNYERNDKIVRIVCMISLLSIFIGIVACVLYLIFKIDFLDIIAVYGVIFFLLPVLLLQTAMPANWHRFGIKNIGSVSWFFFLFMFPVADVGFLCSMNSLYHLIPNFHLITDIVAKEEVRIESMHLFLIYLAVIYVSLIGLGFVFSLFKNKNKNLILA